MHQELYERIQKACGYVTVTLNDELISQGSCFSVLPTGEILTAAHVVTGRLPIKVEDYTDPGCKIYVKFSGLPVIEYGVLVCGIGIQVDAFKDILQVDIAVLVPKRKEDIIFPYLPTKFAIPNLGQQVFLAGYSDELSVPFNLDRIVDSKHPGMAEFLGVMESGYMADMTGPMVKRAVIGNHRRFHASNTDQNVKIDGDILYMDNGIHIRASGGPIVNEDGEAVGVITQRAITSASYSANVDLKVPSGSTIGISVQPLLGIL